MTLKTKFKDVKRKVINDDSYSSLIDFNDIVLSLFPSVTVYDLKKKYLILLIMDFKRILNSFNESDYYFLNNFFESLKIENHDTETNSLCFCLNSDRTLHGINNYNFSKINIYIDHEKNVTLNDGEYSSDNFKKALSDYLNSCNKAFISPTNAMSIACSFYDFHSGNPWDWLTIMENKEQFKGIIENLINFSHLQEDDITESRLQFREQFFSTFGHNQKTFKYIEIEDLVLNYELDVDFRSLLYRIFLTKHIEMFSIKLNDNVLYSYNPKIYIIKSDMMIPEMELPHAIKVDFNDVDNFKCYINNIPFDSIYTTPLEKLKDFAWNVVNLYHDFYSINKSSFFTELYRKSIKEYLQDIEITPLDNLEIGIRPFNEFWNDETIIVDFTIKGNDFFREHYQIDDLENLYRLTVKRQEMNALLEKANLQEKQEKLLIKKLYRL